MPAPDLESQVQKLISSNWFQKSQNYGILCTLMKEGNYNPLLSAIHTCHNQSKFGWISLYFSLHISATSWVSTIREVLAELFVDKNSDFDLDVADSLLYSSKQVCETGQQDGVEITVFRLTLMLKRQYSRSNTSNISSLSFTDCWKTVKE